MTPVIFEARKYTEPKDFLSENTKDFPSEKLFCCIWELAPQFYKTGKAPPLLDCFFLPWPYTAKQIQDVMQEKRYAIFKTRIMDRSEVEPELTLH